MSHREVLIVLAHAMNCPACRSRLLDSHQSVFVGRALSGDERETLAGLKREHFITTDLLAREAGTNVEELRSYADHPVARLRHF